MTLGMGAAIFGCAGPALLPAERAFFRDADPFGFILFARNVETPDRLRRLTADLRDVVGREAPVLILKYDTTEVLPGGAGNAANNVVALGARVKVVGAVGRDDAGRR